MEDDDIDIYEDLPSFETQECRVNKELSDKCFKLEEEVTELKAKLEASDEGKNIIARNMSSLMKTAKAEIARKDRMIAQLRRELDNVTFRRCGYDTKKKQPNYRDKHKEPEQNMEREKLQAPSVKAEPLQSERLTELSDVSDEEIEDRRVLYQQNILTNTVFGERLRKRIMLEQEAEKIQKEEAKIASLEKSTKAQEDVNKKDGNGTDLVKKEDQSPDISKAKEEARTVSAEKSINSQEDVNKKCGSENDLVKKEDQCQDLSNAREEAAIASLEKSTKAQEDGNKKCGSENDLVKKEDQSQDISNAKEEARIKSLEKPTKAQEDVNKKYKSRNSVVKTEHQFQNLSDGSVEEGEISNAPVSRSARDNLQLYREDDKNPYHRPTLKTKLSEKREGSSSSSAHSAHSEHKRRRVEEDRYRREDSRHPNGNFKYDDTHYNFESFENDDYSKISSKHADHRRTSHNRDDTERKLQMRGERFKSIYRSHSNDQRYKERRPDRHRTDKSRFYINKHEKRRHDGQSREGDNWIESNREITDLRDKIDSKVGGRSEYSDYNNDYLDTDRERRAYKSRSLEKSRSRSRGRTRDTKFDNRRTKRSRSTDKQICGKTEVESLEEPPEIQRSKDSKVVKIESKNRDTEPEVPPESLSTGIRNEETNDKISSSEIVVNDSLPNTEIQGDLDNKNTESTNVTLEKPVTAVEDPDKRISVLEKDSEAALIPLAIPKRDNKSDKRRSKRSRSTEKLNSVKTTIEYVEKPPIIQRFKDCKAEPEAPSEFLTINIRNEETKNKISSSEIVVTSSLPNTEIQGDLDHENTEPASVILEKLVTEVENPDKRISVLDKDSETALIPSAIPKRDKKFDKRRSKRSRSTDKQSNVKTTVESVAEPKKIHKLKDSKADRVESKDRDAEPEVPLESSTTIIQNEETNAKISSSEIVVNDSLPNTEIQGDLDRENSESASVTLEKFVTEVETPEKLAVLEKDSEVALVPSAKSEPANLVSSSKEEKIENIEKFIQDYQENEHLCLPITNGESEEREKSSNSTRSIVDTLSMDFEDCPLDKKSENVVFKNLKDESKMDLKEIADESEKEIPKLDILIDQNCPSSEPHQISDDKQISAPEIFEIKADTAKPSTDKVVGKQVKGRSRIRCNPIVSRYSKAKPSVLADFEASRCIVMSESTKNIEADTTLKENIKTRRIPMEELKVQPVENSTNKPDLQIGMLTKLIDDTNSFTGKNLNIIAPEVMNAIDDSCKKEDTGTGNKIENSENSCSVSTSGNNVLHQKKTRPELLAKAETAPKLKDMQEERDKRSALKTVPAPVLSTESKLSNRKRALPKEMDSQSKPAAKQCKIIITARRRRHIQLEDSCTATTLVSSVHDVHWDVSLKNICVKDDKAELSKLVSETAIKGKKRRSTEK